MIFSGPRVLDTLLLFAIGLFPVFLILRFVHVHLRGNNDGNNEPDVHWSFLFNQFVLAAIPGTFIIVVVEMTIFAGLIYAFLGKELIAILQAYEESKNNTDVNSGDDDMSSENILASLPIWKLILVALGNAFIVAATVEEAVKWLFARRALTRHQHQQQDSHQSSSKSVYEILSSACVCGLGLAMVENNAYVLGLSTAKASGTAALISTNKSVFLIALRDVLAFPVHVGATLSIAVTAATNIVNDQLHSHSSTDNDDGVATPPPPKASVAKAWLTAVAYHGLFDGAAMVVAVLVAKKLLPSVMEGVVVALQAALVVAFSILLRARFRALIEREHAFVVQRTEQQQGRQQQQQIGQVGVEQRGDDGCV